MNGASKKTCCHDAGFQGVALVQVDAVPSLLYFGLYMDLVPIPCKSKGFFIEGIIDLENVAKVNKAHKNLHNVLFLCFLRLQSSKVKMTFGEVLTWCRYLNLLTVINGLEERSEHIYAFT